MKLQLQTNRIEELIEKYLVQCEKAMQTGKREDLMRFPHTKLDEQKGDRQDTALTKANSQPKAAVTAAPTPIVTRASLSISTMAMTSRQEKGKESDQEKRKEKQPETAEVVHIE